MLKMRLQRIGRKNDPSYRVVVTDSRNAAKRGTNVDVLGFYTPKSGVFQIDGDRAKSWIAKGVQPSDTVFNFLVDKKLVEGRKRNVLPKKSPVINEAKAAKEAAEKAEAEATLAAEQAPIEEASVAEEAQEEVKVS